MNVANWITKFLEYHNVKHVFMLTGGGAMFLNDALSFNETIKPVFLNHEQACSMAAEGYARVSGSPGVVNVTTGPGGINALNGVYGAFTDSVPMFIISGQVKRETHLKCNPCEGLRQLGDQEVDIVEMARPVCKQVYLLDSVEKMEKTVKTAWATMLEGRPGPVWIDIPIDIQSSPLKDIPSFDLNGMEEVESVKSQETDWVQIFKRLNESERPLIVMGSGVRIAEVQSEVIKIAEYLGIPIATAWAHDLIESDHPLFGGRPGTIGTRQGNMIFQKADCILVLGSRLNIRQTSYNFKSFAKNATLIQVDVDNSEMNKPAPFRKPDISLVANLKDLKKYEKALLSELKAKDRGQWRSWIRVRKERFPIDEVVKRSKTQDNELINPYVLIDAVNKVWGDNGAVVTGNASACIIPFQIWNVKGKNQRLISNSGAASMGYDLPAAIGAAFAQDRVLCLAGDGSIQMNIQELESVQRYGLNLKIIVIDNNGYLSIKSSQSNFFNRLAGCTPESGIGIPNFVKIAEAYEIKSVLIDSKEKLETLLDVHLNESGPCLIHVKVDPNQGFEPRMSSRKNPDGSISSPELEDMHPFLDREILDWAMGDEV